MNTKTAKNYERHVRLAQTFANLEQWYRKAITIRELSKLDVLQLKDIGVTQMDIPRAANDAVQKTFEGGQVNA